MGAIEFTHIKPQPKQEQFLSCPADIAIYGGAAGSAKTYGLILESLRHLNDPHYRAVFFRRTYPDIFLPGGLWDEAMPIYSALGGQSARTLWRFPSGAKIQFSHLQHEKDVETWKGSQVTLFLFDQLEEFSEKMLWYIGLSRGRSKAKAASYIRASCNPDPNSFVANLIEWWIDQDTGYPIEEHSGIIRWFYRKQDKMLWFDSKESAQNFAVEKGYLNDNGTPEKPISLTFIAATLKDNPIGMALNPMYETALKAMTTVDVERLLYGNWKIKESAGNVFRRSFFEMVDTLPDDIYQIRYWDRAATVKSKKNPDPDYTVGLKLGYSPSTEFYYVINIERFRGTPYEVEQAIVNIGKQDGINTPIVLEKDPGQAGIFEQASYEKVLNQFDYHFSNFARTGNKVVRSKGCAAAAQHGRIKVFNAEWNDAFFDELENFPDGKHDDQVDAFSGAFYELNEQLV